MEDDDLFPDLREPQQMPVRLLLPIAHATGVLRTVDNLRRDLDEISLGLATVLARLEDPAPNRGRVRSSPPRQADGSFDVDELYIETVAAADHHSLPLRDLARQATPLIMRFRRIVRAFGALEPAGHDPKERELCVLDLVSEVASRRSLRTAVRCLAREKASAAGLQPSRLTGAFRAQVDEALSRALVRHRVEEIANAPDEPMRFGIDHFLGLAAATVPEVLESPLDLRDVDAAIHALETPVGRWQDCPMAVSYRKAVSPLDRWTFLHVFVQSALDHELQPEPENLRKRWTRRQDRSASARPVKDARRPGTRAGGT